MSLWFTKKDREIANLKAKIANRDQLIDDQMRLIDGLRKIINSLEEDLKASREASYESTKSLETNNLQEVKPVRKTRRAKTSTKKETISKTSTSKK